jgi:hypothetical protein
MPRLPNISKYCRSCCSGASLSVKTPDSRKEIQRDLRRGGAHGGEPRNVHTDPFGHDGQQRLVLHGLQS